MDVSVIIVNWNSKEFVRQCLRSLYRHVTTTSFEVIVVDGASFDGCDVMLATEFPDARYVQSAANVGFARANNLGATQARGRYLLFLNPDTELLDDALSLLLGRLRSLPNAGAVGCRLLNRDRSLQTSCVQAFPTVFNQIVDSEFLRARFPRWSIWGTAAFVATGFSPAPVQAVSGACILISRARYDAIGGFSEHYFMYGEDLDLCYKVHRSGAIVYYVSEVAIVHFGGGSSTQVASAFSNVMMRESVCRFVRHHHGWLAAFAYRVGMTITALLRLAAIGPMMLLGNSVVRHGSGSWTKWVAILGWSIGVQPSRPGDSNPPLTSAVLDDSRAP